MALIQFLNLTTLQRITLPTSRSKTCNTSQFFEIGNRVILGRLWCQTFSILIFSTNLTSYYIISFLLYLLHCSIYWVIFYSPILFCPVFHYPTLQIDQSPLQSWLDDYYHYIIILFSIIFYYTKMPQGLCTTLLILIFHVLQSLCSTQKNYNSCAPKLVLNTKIKYSCAPQLALNTKYPLACDLGSTPNRFIELIHATSLLHIYRINYVTIRILR